MELMILTWRTLDSFGWEAHSCCLTSLAPATQSSQMPVCVAVGHGQGRETWPLTDRVFQATGAFHAHGDIQAQHVVRAETVGECLDACQGAFAIAERGDDTRTLLMPTMISCAANHAS